MNKISEEQIVLRIQAENPWWEKPDGVPDIFSSLTPRPYLDLLYPLIKQRSVRRAVVLMGPRRVGKTVMIHHAIAKLMKEGTPPRSICYISVDHPVYNNLDIDRFMEAYRNAAGVDFEKHECFIFFDEIQYLKSWEKYIKAVVDRYSSVKCFVSGSAAAALRLKSTESGAGRFTDFLLPPLTFHEYLFLLKEDTIVINEDILGYKYFINKSNIDKLNDHFINYINYGGYPEVVFSEKIQMDPGRFIKNDIIDKVLLRDLPGLYGIQDIQELNYLFTTLAFNTANELSLEELSKNSGVAKNTIKRYIEYLEAAFLLKIVHRVDRNAKRFKRANFFKVYLTNPSIRTALFSPVTSHDTAIGSLVETAIFSQWFHSNELLHYARWKNGEVDIVILDSTQKVKLLVEVKWSDRYYNKPQELKSLLSFSHTHNLKSAAVTTKCTHGNINHKSVTLGFMPASFYCFAIGYGIVQGKKIDQIFN